MLKRRSGLTLIEVLVTVALVGGVIGVLTLVITSGFQGAAFFQTRGQTASGLAYSLETIASSATLASNLPATYTSGSNNYTASSSTLIITLPSIDTQGAAISGSSDTIVYVYDSNTKDITQYTYPAQASARSQDTRKIAKDLVGATFTQNLSGSKYVTINLTGAQTESGRQINFPLSQTVYLINQTAP